MKSPLVPLLAALAALAGCSTSLSGRREPLRPLPEKTGDPSDPGGVPVQLTTPTFALVQKPAADGKPLSYALTVAYRPDPSQRYRINIQPFRLATTELSLAFGSAGQLSALNGAASDQAMATVTAIGEFAVSALGAAAKVAGGLAAGDTAGDGYQDLRALIKGVEALEATGWCKSLDPAPRGTGSGWARPVAAYLPETRCPVAVPAGGKRACQVRGECIKGHLLEGLEPGLKDETLAELLHPLTMEERDWLEAAATVADAAGATLKQRFARAKAALPGAAEAQAVAEVEAAVEAQSLDRLAEARCAQAGCLDEGGVATSAWTDLKRAAELRIREARLAAALRKAGELTSEAWRSRRVEALERRIAWAQNQASVGDPRASPAAVATLRRQLAAALDVVLERDRIQELERQLASPAPRSAKAEDLALREDLRREREELLTLVAQRRLAVRAPAATPPKAQERELRLAPVWRSEPGPATAAYARREAAKQGLPEFLLVIERGTQP